MKDNISSRKRRSITKKTAAKKTKALSKEVMRSGQSMPSPQDSGHLKKQHKLSSKKDNQQDKTVLSPSYGIHNLKKPKGSHKRKKLLGRGPSSGHGKTSTRGSKGQTSRSGRDFYLGFEGGQMPLIRKIPKRGFTNKFKKEYQIVNLNDLNNIKESSINLELLEERGLIKDKDKLVKILGEGELKSPISIRAHAFSESAVEKIKNAGGTVEVVSV